MAIGPSGSTGFATNASGCVYVARPFTMHVRARLDTATWFTGFSQYDAGANGNFFIQYSGSSNNWIASERENDGSYYTSNFGSSSSTGQSYSLCAVFRSTTSRQIYVDGTAGTENTQGPSVTGGIDSVSLGGSSANGATLDHAIWNRELTSAEMLALADGVSPLLIAPSNLVRFWLSRNRQDPIPEVIGGFSASSGSPAYSANPKIILPSAQILQFQPPAGGSLSAETGYFTLTGQSAALLRQLKMDADQGSFTLSGQDVDFTQQFLMQAEQGSFVVSGQAAALTRQLLMTAAQGAFTLSGQAVTFIESQTMPADTGYFTLTGQDVNLLVQGKLSAETGYFTVSGQDAALVRQLLMQAGQGTFTVSGQAAGVAWNRLMSADYGSFTVNGQDVAFTQYLLTPETGYFTLSGQALNFVFSGPIIPSTGYSTRLYLDDMPKTLVLDDLPERLLH